MGIDILAKCLEMFPSTSKKILKRSNLKKQEIEAK